MATLGPNSLVQPLAAELNATAIFRRILASTPYCLVGFSHYHKIFELLIMA